jgi:glycosyltransferase involved in cell wall biosynthesis
MKSNASRFFMLFFTFYLSRYSLSDKRFAVVIPSYNNSKWYEKNLDSLFSQTYQQFRVLYIVDDAFNDDGTAEAVEKYKKLHNLEDRFILIKNKKRRYKAANVYSAIHACSDDEIIVMYDGDDWFADSEVLAYLNDLYADDNIWLTAGGYREYPSGKPGYTRPIPEHIIKANAFRTYGRTTGQLRTFRSWLFKLIKLEDFFYEGSFLERTGDVAKMMPMLEMAGERIAFNYRVVYNYNLANVLNDHKVDPQTQTKICDYVLSRPRYARLAGPLINNRLEAVKNAKIDVILCSSTLSKTSGFLHSLQGNTCIESIIILSDTFLSSDLFYYTKKFPHLRIYLVTYRQFSEGKAPFFAEADTNKYVLLARDVKPLDRGLSLTDSIRMLEKTGAYSFYLEGIKRKEDMPTKSEHIEGNTHAWQYAYTNGIWNNPHSIESNLYRKREFIEVVNKISFKNSRSFKETYKKAMVSSDKIGLFNSGLED